MDRAEKEQTVANLHGIFADAALLVITQQSGMTVAEATELRRGMKNAGATYRVIKNRLARIALDGTPYAPLSDLFSGPIAIAYSEDSVAAAKVTVEYAKKNKKLLIIGGAMREQALDVNGIRALASLPSLDELRGRIVGLIQAPATKVAGVLQAPAGQLARVLNAYATKDEAA